MPCSAVTLSLATITAIVATALLAIAFSTDNWVYYEVRRNQIQVSYTRRAVYCIRLLLLLLLVPIINLLLSLYADPSGRRERFCPSPVRSARKYVTTSNTHTTIPAESFKYRKNFIGNYYIRNFGA